MDSEQSASEIAKRRLTLTRMLIWAAGEAREIGNAAAAERIEEALASMAAAIGERTAFRKR